MNGKTMRNSFLLFLTACIWGFAFVSQSKGMEAMGPFTFNGVRSLLGALVVLPLVLCRLHKRKAEIAGTKELSAAPCERGTGINWRLTVTGGLFCGLFYAAASTLQQFGIAYTTVGKAGFITTLYIIFVPLFGLFLGKRIAGRVWMGAGLAAAGMYMLCMTESLSLTPGDFLVFAGAVLFALHILVIDYYSPRTEGVILSFIQLFVCGAGCLTLAFLFENPSLMQIKEGMIPVLYAGIMSCGVAYTLQIVGQKGVNPTAASLILSLESVVAALAGFLAYKLGFLKTDQTLTARQIAGCAVVFAAVLLVQLPIAGKNKKQKRIHNNP